MAPRSREQQQPGDGSSDAGALVTARTRATLSTAMRSRQALHELLAIWREEAYRLIGRAVVRVAVAVAGSAGLAVAVQWVKDHLPK
jgi:hypothetical protein